MKKTIILLLSTSVLTGCVASSGVQKLNTTDTRVCAQNFTYDGSFLAGRTFKTYEYVPDVSQATAMKKAARYTVNDGWTIISTSNELGIISASQTVSYGSGKTVPLNISIEPMESGINIAMSYSLSGGLTSPVEAVKDHFCATIDAVRNK